MIATNSTANRMSDLVLVANREKKREFSEENSRDSEQFSEWPSIAYRLGCYDA